MGISKLIRYSCDGKGCGFVEEHAETPSVPESQHKPVVKVFATFSGIGICLEDGYLCRECRDKLADGVSRAWEAVMPEIPF